MRTVGLVLIFAVPVILVPFAIVYVLVLIGRVGGLGDSNHTVTKVAGPSLADLRQRADERLLARALRPALVVSGVFACLGLFLVILAG